MKLTNSQLRRLIKEEIKLASRHAPASHNKFKFTKTELVNIVKEEVNNLMKEGWGDYLSAANTLKDDAAEAEATKLSGDKKAFQKQIIAELPALFDPNSELPNSFVHVQEEDSKGSVQKYLESHGEELASQMANHLSAIFAGEAQYTEEPWLARTLPVAREIYGDEDPVKWFSQSVEEYIRNVLLKPPNSERGSIVDMIKNKYIKPEDPGLTGAHLAQYNSYKKKKGIK
jgi:hypothetical protein